MFEDKIKILLEETQEVVKDVDPNIRKGMMLLNLANMFTTIHNSIVRTVKGMKENQPEMIEEVYTINEAGKFFVDALADIDSLLYNVVIPAIHNEFARYAPEDLVEIVQTFEKIKKNASEREDKEISSAIDSFLEQMAKEQADGSQD